MCVRKREQKCSPVSDYTEKSKYSSNCVIKNILQYHQMMTFDLENDLKDEYWENKLNSNMPWYNLHCCSSIAFKNDLIKYNNFSENNENVAEDDENDEDDEDNIKPLPPYIEMVLSIMKRVLHYLPSKHNSLPLQVLYSFYLL